MLSAGTIVIDVSVGSGPCSATGYGCDLTYDYVRVSTAITGTLNKIHSYFISGGVYMTDNISAAAAAAYQEKRSW